MNDHPFNRILAIESSCDETAVSIIEQGTVIKGSSVASSSVLHAKYGGIVPEVAAREQLDYIIPTIKDALSQLSHEPIELYESYVREHIDAIAVAHGPGLIGSLLVGVETAKTLAFAIQKPLVPVNHVLAHMYANFLTLSTSQNKPITFPAISLVVSGGHTELYSMNSVSDLHWLGGTLDDAAGEAFDKTARLLGFENRGGPAIQESAQLYKGEKIHEQVRLPRPMLDKDHIYDFSFSGLKTAIANEVARRKKLNLFDQHSIHWLSYEVQETITDVLVRKTVHAAVNLQAASILLSGGVAANLRLREKFIQELSKLDRSITLHVPPVSLCTDNAAYIGSYAYFRGVPVPWKDVNAVPDLSVEV